MRIAFCGHNEERNRLIKNTGREGRKEGLRNMLTFLTKGKDLERIEYLCNNR